MHDRIVEVGVEGLAQAVNGLNAQLFQVRQPGDDALQITYTVAEKALCNESVGGAEITTPEQLDEYGEALWKDIMDSINQSSHDYQDHYERAERESKGLTAGGWIVLLILISILFRKNKGDRRGCGCGCSPLGWVLSLLGLEFLFDNRPN